MPEPTTSLSIEQLQERERQLNEALTLLNRAQFALHPLQRGADGEIDIYSVGIQANLRLGEAWVLIYDERERVQAAIRDASAAEVPDPPVDDHTDDICPCGDPECNRPWGHAEEPDA